MEWDQREPCLSPAAFVNQVQYSNILEGRFKQLQGKSQTSMPKRVKGEIPFKWWLKKCSFTGLVTTRTFTDAAIESEVFWKFITNIRIFPKNMYAVC